ncbi:hypothetical protein [Paraburkholderia sp.]|uniref:hypothetical protein n=1 Tax=Paraburkholderia sp. TaxID=1926495 RepID=UPI002AFEB804|nr:hypothetical protein [Paraburkholderia sp.]
MTWVSSTGKRLNGTRGLAVHRSVADGWWFLIARSPQPAARCEYNELFELKSGKHAKKRHGQFPWRFCIRTTAAQAAFRPRDTAY